jgi:hypothetical protein
MSESVSCRTRFEDNDSQSREKITSTTAADAELQISKQKRSETRPAHGLGDRSGDQMMATPQTCASRSVAPERCGPSLGQKTAPSRRQSRRRPGSPDEQAGSHPGRRRRSPRKRSRRTAQAERRRPRQSRRQLGRRLSTSPPGETPESAPDSNSVFQDDHRPSVERPERSSDLLRRPGESFSGQDAHLPL